MSDLKTLVENYFAPKPKTLTKQMLYEIFDEVMREQEEQDTDPFKLDSSLSGEEVASILLGKIAQVSPLPKGATYKGGKRTIVLDNFGPLQDRHKIIKALMGADIISQTEPYRAGLSRDGLTNYYFVTKGGKRQFIKLVMKHGGSGTLASKGDSFEKTVANQINAFLADRMAEDDFIADVIVDATATAEGGSTGESDVVIKDATTGKTLVSFETKTSKGSRVDLGQFTIKYENEKGKKGQWVKAPKKRGKETETMKKVFDEIKVSLNTEIKPATNKPFPTGPMINSKGAEDFWNTLGEPRGKKSLSGNVREFEISKNLIQEYYGEKGDTYAILGNDIYSLVEDKGTGLPQLSSAMKRAYALFRIKYHGPNYSYTVALRADFAKDSKPGFTKSLEKIFPSLPNPEEE